MKDLIYGAKFGMGFVIGQQVVKIGLLALLRGLMGKEAFYQWVYEYKTK